MYVEFSVSAISLTVTFLYFTRTSKRSDYQPTGLSIIMDDLGLVLCVLLISFQDSVGLHLNREQKTLLNEFIYQELTCHFLSRGNY